MATAKQITNKIRLNKKTIARLEKDLKSAKLHGTKLAADLKTAAKVAPAKKKAKAKAKKKK